MILDSFTIPSQMTAIGIPVPGGPDALVPEQRPVPVPGEDEVLIRVDDDGPGIPRDQLDAVLKPFARLDTARQRNTSGLGLGLAIVQKAVDAEGGKLTLANRPEGGLRAEICLFLPSGK